MTAVHHFFCTADAYDATQTRNDVADGDTLVCDEGVVGVAHTWPFAVTVAFGELHRVADLAALCAETGITRDQIQKAVRYATALGLPIDPVCSF